MTPAELEPIADEATNGDIITLQKFSKKGNLVHVCGCTNPEYEFEPIDPNIMRAKSDAYLAGGSTHSADGWTNLVWSWGQFIDHGVRTVNGAAIANAWLHQRFGLVSQHRSCFGYSDTLAIPHAPLLC